MGKLSLNVANGLPELQTKKNRLEETVFLIAGFGEAKARVSSVDTLACVEVMHV